MKKNPQVTTGLCIKNSVSTISRVLNSISIQNYPQNNLELIIVDGYSNDGTTTLIKEYLIKEKTISSQLFFENEGLGKARQLCDNFSTVYEK